MFSRIETISEKKLIGKSIRMSFINDRTRELWQFLMPRRKEIKNNVNDELISLEVYNDTNFFENFDPSNEFDKWAAIEVSDYNTIPEGMEKLIVPEGSYAVFIHKGPANEGPLTYNYIFGTWIPNSEYKLDNRPHFAVMAEKYKREERDSEEEIWIPIQKK